MASDADMPSGLVGFLGFILGATIAGTIGFSLGRYDGKDTERRKAVEANLAVYEFDPKTGDSLFRYKMRDELCK